MLQHAVAAVGCHDAERHVARVADLVVVREVHRPRMEGSDLVVVEVGGDEGLRGVGVGHAAHVGGGQPEVLEALQVEAGVVANRRHDQRRAAEQLEVVGDVAGTAAVFAPHVGHQEGDVEDVDLLRQDVVLEAVLEHHDGVVGE